MFRSGRALPREKRSADSGATSTNGSRRSTRSRTISPDGRGLQEPVAGEAGRVQEAGRGGRLADQRVVIGAHLVQAGPAGAYAGAREGRGAPFDRLGELGQPALVVLELEAGLLVEAHAHQQPVALAVEVEAVREVDRHGQRRGEAGDGLGHEHLPAERRDVELDACQRAERSATTRPPRTRRCRWRRARVMSRRRGSPRPRPRSRRPRSR